MIRAKEFDTSKPIMDCLIENLDSNDELHDQIFVRIRDEYGAWEDEVMEEMLNYIEKGIWHRRLNGWWFEWHNKPQD